MTMEKLYIKNRRGVALAVIVASAKPQKGLAFVMHGLGGFKEQEAIVAVADVLHECGYCVVRFDASNSFGESGGTYEDATITNCYEDLEDVIAWAEGQAWYQVPFVLSGHSLGGICTALFAEKYPEKVCALAPLSPVVSGALSVQAAERKNREDLLQWEKTGWKVRENRLRPGEVMRLPWTHMLDRLQYDLLPGVARLSMPVLLIVGERDTSTPPDHVRMLFDALVGPKEFHVIAGAPHTIREQKHLAEIKNLFLQWIDTFSKSRD